MTVQPQSGFVPEFTIGDRLRKAREAAGYEQGPFAALMGVSRGTISNYERETGTKPPKPIVLNMWSERTGVNLDWILTGQGHPTDSPTPPSGPTDELEELTRAKRARHGHNGVNRRPDSDTDWYDVAA